MLTGRIWNLFLLSVAVATAPGAIVTNTNDAGPGSLRQAILQAVPGEHISFSLPRGSAAIGLTSGELFINKNLSLSGAGGTRITITKATPNARFRIFRVTAGATVVMDHLVLRGGDDLTGGALHTLGRVTLSDVQMDSNRAQLTGAAIYNGPLARLTLERVTISRNAAGDAGAIYHLGSNLFLFQCTIVANTSTNPGAALVTAGTSRTDIAQSTVTGNTSAGPAIDRRDSSAIFITSSIVARNAPANLSSGIFNAGFNFVSGDPKLQPLGFYGGFTETRPPGFGSPVIDQGRAAGTDADQRELPRIVNFPDISDPENGDGADIGSVELQTGFAQFLNLSTRARVGTGDRVLIAGFILTGPSTSSKRILLRGLGPSLSTAGIDNPLSNPVLHLANRTNNNWKDDQEGEIRATGLAPAEDKEAAIVQSFAPGAFTAILEGRNGGEGIGLVELYDLEPNAEAVLANLSTRGWVGTGEDVMIAGFVAGAGPGAGASIRVLVRALGPSLAALGLAGTLQDPQIELRDRNGNLVDANDDWATHPNSGQIAPGSRPSDSRESALLVSLPADAYTVIVRGKNGTTGIALVELFRLP